MKQPGKDFRNGSPKAYDAAYKSKNMDLVCSHMEYIKKPNGHWTREKCQIEANKYSTRGEFIKKGLDAYTAATKMNILDEVCSHMISKFKPQSYWTKEKCLREALKYSNRNE